MLFTLQKFEIRANLAFLLINRMRVTINTIILLFCLLYTKQTKKWYDMGSFECEVSNITFSY